MGAVAWPLAGHQLVALVTSIWIYHFEGSTAFARTADQILQAISTGKIAVVASELVLLELLVGPLRQGALDVADEIEMAVSHLPNLRLEPVSRGILLRAADIRARHGLRTPDSIMIATAIAADASLVISNDRQWKKVKEIDVLLLDDFPVREIM